MVGKKEFKTLNGEHRRRRKKEKMEGAKRKRNKK